MTSQRTSRALAVLAALPLSVWSVFHLWEQYAAFAGREAWIHRMRVTSVGWVSSIEWIAVVLPLMAWIALFVRTSIERRQIAAAPAQQDDSPLSRVLLRVAPYASVVVIAFLIFHMAWLWLPRVAWGRSLSETWHLMTQSFGRPPLLAVHSIAFLAVAIHLAAALPIAFEALGWIDSKEGRRSAFLVSSTFALCVWVLAVQLYGWLATGLGTLWPIAAAG